MIAVAALVVVGAVTISTAHSARAATGDTSIVVQSTRPTANYGDPGKIVATVKSAAKQGGIPTGSVDFTVDGSYYWTAQLDATGKATWKRLPGGGIPVGGVKGIGVGMAQYTGYFATMANTANYVAIHCR